MAREDASPDAIPKIFQLNSKVTRLKYFFLSLILVLGLRTVENAFHEWSHGLMVIIVGGQLPENPFFISPFGGFTRWSNVPLKYLPLVNIAGTLFSLFAMLLVFLPLYRKARKLLVKMIGYWGSIVIPVNSVYYWLVAPFIGTSRSFDPIAFAANLGISPTWIIGVYAAIPFSYFFKTMIKETRKLNFDKTLEDPSFFHVKCLIFYYSITFLFSTISYLGILDQFKWW
ncbi:MAG: hypothetical protein ACTSVI_17280 [Promethearchaeota archaeon]